jgi:CRP/FNR family transcriptional regulator, cyclic AMP receptor protein
MSDAYPLERLPIFRNISADQLEPLHRCAVRQVFEEGAPIFRQGDIPEYFYIVEEGIVDIVLPAVADEITVATFESGSFFGELGVFDNQPRTATARACVDTALICIPVSVLADLVENHPSAAKQFMSVIIERLRGADEMLSRLMIRNVNEIADEKMTFGERVADLVARFGGSWTFIISFGVFLCIWMAVNTAWILTSPPDPFPYIFLNLILSCLAALQAPVIMMSQNRQASKDRLQADQDYQVNVKAEFAIQQLHRKLDEMRASLTQHRRAEQEHWRQLQRHP